MDMEKSTFIKIDKFESAMGAISVIKKKLAEAQATLGKIQTLKQEEDAAVEKWQAELQSVEEKVHAVESELMNE